MAFVSRNPKTVLNPEAAENYISVEPKNLQPGQEFIGYFKNMYRDSVYNNNCYVFKGKEDGRDYLFYGTKSLKDEMVYYSQGDLVSIIYKGQHENKKGPFAGKFSHVWKVTGEDSWAPTPEFIAELQQEVYNRKIEVQRILSTPRGFDSTIQNQHATISQLQNNAPQLQSFGSPQGFAPTFVAPVSHGNISGFSVPVKKSSDPFG